MPRLDLLEPLLTGGVRHPNYFNGRVLTAEALADDRAALHAHTDRLGRAVGEGVAYGLEVTPGLIRSGTPSVEVAPGLAVNRKGQTLCIPEAVGPVEVALSREPRVRDLPEGTGTFEACRPEDRFEDDGFQAKLDPGPYVLAIGPLSAFEGSVPGVGAGTGGVATFCGSAFETEGVYLRLVSLRLAEAVGRLVAEGVRSSNRASRSRARNVLAHHTLGTPDLGAFRANPRTAGAGYGLVDAMRAAGDLDACEVPLALLFWDEDVLHFVDTWAVRRTLAASGASAAWRLHAVPRRATEAEAAFLQFQAQVQEERSTGSFRLDAVEAFRYLPAAGYVPAASEDTFFERIPVRNRRRADEAFLRSLVHDSFYADPIDLDADPRPEVDLYDCPSSNLILFVRAADVRSAERPVEPEGGRGRIEVTIDLDPERRPGSFTGRERERRGGGAIERIGDFALAEEPPRGFEAMTMMRMPTNTGSIRDDGIDSFTDKVRSTLTVDAVHVASGRTIPGTLDAGRVKTLFAERAFRRAGDLDELRYTFPPLEPGAYKVRLRGEGLRTQATQRTVEAEETEQVAFDLFPAQGTRPSGRPPKRGGAGNLGPGWYEDVHLNEPLVDAYLDWPWDDRDRFERIEEIPPEVEGFLVLWGDDIRTRYPDAPVMDDVAVYLDRDYTPDSTPPDDPYAYAVFGEGGAFVPLVLTSSTRSLGHPVGVGKSGLFGGDAGIERRLGAVGADEVDVLANAWGGLVADATGVSPEAGRDIVAGARGAAETLQDSLVQFTGITADIAARLAEAGIATPTDLANASSETLRAAFGENAAFNDAWGELLIGEARASVPASAWSLDAAVDDAGLREALGGAGVRSLGDLERRDVGEVAGHTGVSVERVREIATGAADARAEAGTRLRAERRARAPVSGVEGVGGADAVALARAGFASTRALANADADAVAGALGIEANAARGLIANAGRRLGR